MIALVVEMMLIGTDDDNDDGADRDDVYHDHKHFFGYEDDNDCDDDVPDGDINDVDEYNDA